MGRTEFSKTFVQKDVAQLLFKSLATDYICVSYVNALTDEEIHYRVSDILAEKIVGWRETNNFSKRLDLLIEQALVKDDRSRFFCATRKETVLEILKVKPEYIVNFKMILNNEIRFFQIKFVKDVEEKDFLGLIIGIQDISETINKEIEIQEEIQDFKKREKVYEALKKQSQEVIDVLAAEYTSVYYIGLKRDLLTPYRIDEVMARTFGELYKREVGYSEAFFEYINQAVFIEDRASLLEFGSLNNLAKLLQKKASITKIYRSIINGKIEYFEMKFVKLVAEDGNINVVLGIANKDNEVKEQEEYRKQQERNHEIIEILASEYSSVYYVDLDTEELTPYTMNEETKQNIEKILTPSITFSEAFKLYVNEMVIDEDKEAILKAGSIEAIKENLRGKKTYLSTYRSKNSGTPHYCEMKFVKVGNEEEARAVALGFADKDNEIRQEQERKATLETAMKEAKAASEAKSTFLFNMSHDIRTPMNAILGFTKMAKNNLDDIGKVEDCLDKVFLSGNHLLSLINDVLDMAKIESGKIVIEESDYSIKRLADNFMTMVLSSAEMKDITLSLSLINIRNDYVLVDGMRLERIALNIVSNAIKYTKPGGKVLFSIEQVESQKEGYGAYVFTVKDNGIGMSEEFLSHIFDSFSRERSSTKSGIQGTGLGMPITKNLVEMMGGTIDVVSELNKGTVVTWRLDFRLRLDPIDREDIEMKPSLQNLNGKRVLLVEDNDLNREIARDILEENNMEVEEANDGSVAVEMVKNAVPFYYDFVLMDIQMPYMDGYNATKIIRGFEDKDKALVPIIAMTANAFDEDRKKALETGMNAHVAKPINIDSLLDTLCRFT